MREARLLLQKLVRPSAPAAAAAEAGHSRHSSALAAAFPTRARGRAAFASSSLVISRNYSAVVVGSIFARNLQQPPSTFTLNEKKKEGSKVKGHQHQGIRSLTSRKMGSGFYDLEAKTLDGELVSAWKRKYVHIAHMRCGN